MSISRFATLVGVFASISRVTAHGYVSGAIVDGTYFQGYLVNTFPYENPPPVVIGWTETATDLGYVAPGAYGTSDIICHKSATPGQATAPVKAGGTVELQWTVWPSSHHGPVIDYLANCQGPCETVDKTTLEWFKIDQSGLIDDTTVPGNWASDQLIANNNSWTVTIPTCIAPGNYTLRHEIIALHSAGNSDGAQNYPQCLNLEVSGSGTDAPAGVLGTALYTETDPGILVNIYQSLSSYSIPGPTLYSGDISAAQPTGSASSNYSASVSAISAASVASAASGSLAPPLAPVSSLAAVACSSDDTTAATGGSGPTTAQTATPASSSHKSCTKVNQSSTSTAPATPVVTDSPAAVTAPVASITSDRGSLTSDIPSTILTSIITSVPTTPASSGNSVAGSDDTGVALPKNMTVAQLLAWLKEIVDELTDAVASSSSKVKRSHARDMAV